MDICIECIEDIQKLSSIKDEKLSKKLKHKLLITAIITYGKCFASRDGTKIEWIQILTFLNNNPIFSEENKNVKNIMSGLHNKIINMRNKYNAHHYNIENEEVLLWCYLNPDLNKKSIYSFLHELNMLLI